MIDFYTYNTFNGQAVAIALKEMALEHRTIVIDLTQGEQKQPEFLSINPSGRIPVIVDHSTQPKITLCQTGAILIYLAEKTGLLLPQESHEKAKVLEWMMFQLTDISPNVFNNFYLKCLVSPKQPEAANYLKQRSVDFYSLFEQQLSASRYLVGDHLSLADVVAFPVVEVLKGSLSGSDYPAVMKWHAFLSERLAFHSALEQGR